MEKVDLVMVGAEGVAESGGIINKVGGGVIVHSAGVDVCYNIVGLFSSCESASNVLLISLVVC